MNMPSCLPPSRVFLAGAVAFASIATVLVARTLMAESSLSGGEVASILSQPEDGVNNAEMILLSDDEVIGSIIEGVCDKAMKYAEVEGKIPASRLTGLRKAMECSLEALFGKPDSFVQYQQKVGGVLNSKMLRSWLEQLHEWDMMSSVTGDVEDDVVLYKQIVKASDERYATIEAVLEQKIEAGGKLGLDYGSPEWPFNGHRLQLCMWQSPSGTLQYRDGETIKDGSTGRTFHVTVPVRYTYGGNGVLRVNFYWDEESEYWVPHMVIMAAGGDEGSMWPMHVF